MKRKYFLFVGIFLFPFIMSGQETLNKLTIPSSPASSILGLQPSVILTPKSYQSLETTLFSNFINSEGNTIIPNDFSLEFTPYWTINHGLSVAEYLYPKSIMDQISRNSSFSLASTQNILLGDSSKSNGLAFGYRTTLYFGNKADRERIEKYKTNLKIDQKIHIQIALKAEEIINNGSVKNKKDFLNSIKESIADIILINGFAEDIDEAKEITNRILKKALLLPEFNVDNSDTFLDSFYNLIEELLNSEQVYHEFESYIKERQGLLIDVAYAGYVNFPTNNFEFSFVPSQSIWITPTYRFNDKLNFLKILAVYRYEWYNQDYYKRYFPQTSVYTNNSDYGLAVSGNFKKFSLQFEYVKRNSNTEIPAGKDQNGNDLFFKKKKSDYQYIGTFSYNLSDEIVLSYSLGNKFEYLQNPFNSLISILTLNFGFGTPTEKDLYLTK